MNVNSTTKKRKRANSKLNTDSSNSKSNEIWNLKKFNTKEDLEKFINDQGYRYRSNEENTEKQSCRFCLAINPNSHKHMIQVYLYCSNCKKSNITCSKTNICEKLKKYEILTKHIDLNVNEWIIFDRNTILPENGKNDDEIIFDKFINLNISSKIRNDYYNRSNYYLWIVQDVFPNQTNLYKEIYIIKIDDKWKEFSNGVEKHSFKIIADLDDEIILKRDDDSIFKLKSKEFFNSKKNKVKYEGEWIFDKNFQVN